jgi:hypothetical protein
MRRRAEFDAALARVSIERAGYAAYEVAQVHAYGSEIDQAFSWLKRACEQKDFVLFFVKDDSLFKNIERDPHYKAFLHKMKLPKKRSSRFCFATDLSERDTHARQILFNYV